MFEAILTGENTTVYPEDFYKINSKYEGDFPNNLVKSLTYTNKKFSLKLQNGKHLFSNKNFITLGSKIFYKF